MNNLCIDGDWGTGKTTFANNLADYINESNDQNYTYKIIYLDVWKYEISDNPLISILVDLILNMCYTKQNNLNKKAIALDAIAILLEAIKITKPLGKMIKEFTNEKTKYRNEDSIINKEISSKLSINDSINNLIAKINDLVANSKQEKDDQDFKNASDINIVRHIIILDELDRSTTSELIKLFSMIKNLLYKIQNVFFIIICNKSYLENVINNDNNSNYTDKINSRSVNIANIIGFEPHLIDKKMDNIYAKFINYLKISDYRLIKRTYRDSIPLLRKLQNIKSEFEYLDNFKEIFAFWLNLYKDKGKISHQLRENYKKIDMKNVKQTYYISRFSVDNNYPLFFVIPFIKNWDKFWDYLFNIYPVEGQGHNFISYSSTLIKIEYEDIKNFLIDELNAFLSYFNSQHKYEKLIKYKNLNNEMQFYGRAHYEKTITDHIDEAVNLYEILYRYII